nr:crs2-associated factor 1, mitochondrial [Quercus suber]
MLMQDMVPCILVTFEKEQIVVWRGKDYKPVEDGCFLPDRESFDDMDGSSSDGSLACGEEGCDSVDGTRGQRDFHSGDDD